MQQSVFFPDMKVPAKTFGMSHQSREQVRFEEVFVDDQERKHISCCLYRFEVSQAQSWPPQDTCDNSRAIFEAVLPMDL
jgi:hypothetical protein